MPRAVCGRRRNDILYEMRYESGRATARVAPTKGYKECDVVKNPPVTASPCQPPLGKGAERTGVRIATGGVRTDFAMTCFLQGGRGKSGWADGLLVVRWGEVKKRQRGGAAFMLFRPGSP